MKFCFLLWVLLALNASFGYAQKFDEDRMKRDIEVAENVLSTLVKQQFGQQRRGWFGIDVKGSYLPGYGVTFRLPADFNMPFMLTVGSDKEAVIFNRDESSFSFSIQTGDDEDGEEPGSEKKAMSLKETSKENKKLRNDSAHTAYREKVIRAAKDFIVDYGDFITQLGPNERIIVTNQGEHRFYYSTRKRMHISVEGTKADVLGFRQGKLSRDQALAKLKVINTESIDERQPDMELLSSIIGRLYKPDLSKTYFTEENIYYEILKDYGAVFYMSVYSSNEVDAGKMRMPTQGNEVMDKAARDKKVAELYPAFEKDLKENMIEYGRTLKSLKNDENLVFNVTLTKCKGCNIPSKLELSVKNSVLQDFNAGRIDKSAAISKIMVKKGANQ